ncbi:hypothetical protein [Pseudarthrobacter sp. C4D7]|nr:hypothetical protein [Pseudarthrobacter sp. C4D7]
MKNPRKDRSRIQNPGGAERPTATQLHVPRPWEGRSFDAALSSMLHIR